MQHVDNWRIKVLKNNLPICQLVNVPISKCEECEECVALSVAEM
jgi:hypothetical protein